MMRLTGLAGLLSAGVLASSCAATVPAPAATAKLAEEGDPRVTLNSPQAEDADFYAGRVVISAARVAKRNESLSSYLSVLSNSSCPQGSATRGGEPIALKATPTALQPSNPAKRKIGALTYVAGYQLTSTDPRFGGLSGIEVLDNGDLLTISDAGYFIWIDLDTDGLRPEGARLSTMRDASGGAQTGIAGDSAEGLAVNGGMALVSFEGNHRVLAYDLGRCGAAARGAPIVFGDYGLDLRDAYEEARIAVGAGNGSEPLAVTRDWYLFAGIEKKVGHLNSLSARPIEAEPDFNLRVGVDAPEFAGIDVIPGAGGNNSVRAFLIHRSPNPRDGRVWVTETDMQRYEDRTRNYGPVRGEMDTRARQRYSETGWRELAQLNQFGVVDNFEGIAAKELSDGRTRLYLISDDDYSPGKRTVLMIFDLARPMR